MMWRSLFQSVLKMSLMAGVAVIVVLAARLLLRRAPKIFSYALWAIVLFRLCCPVSVSSSLSLFGVLERALPEMKTEQEYLSEIGADPESGIVNDQSGNPVVGVPNTDPVSGERPQPGTVQQAGNVQGQEGNFPAQNGNNQSQAGSHPIQSENKLPQSGIPVMGESSANVSGIGAAWSADNWMLTASWIWAGGMLAMAVYSLVSVLSVRRRLVGAVPLRDNIYVCDYLETPFVMGVFRPRIYLCSTLKEHEMEYIILHEQHHIRRFDHVIKLLAFAVLCVHWFNPLVWVAFILAGKDMEMSCDEAVVKRMGERIRWDYSKSLLVLATGHQSIAGAPLAFGEGSTKGRIHNLLKKKKAGKWLAGVAAVVLVVVGVLLLTDPVGSNADDPAGNEVNGQFGDDDQSENDQDQQISLTQADEQQSGDAQENDSTETENDVQTVADASANCLDNIEGEKTLKQKLTDVLWQRMVSMVLDLAPSDRDDWLAYWSGESQVEMILGNFDEEYHNVWTEGKDSPWGRSYQVNAAYDRDEAYNTGWFWNEHCRDLSLEELYENADKYLGYSYSHHGDYHYSEDIFAKHRSEGLLEVSGSLKRQIYPAGETFLNQRGIEGQYIDLWNAVMGAVSELYLEELGGIPERMAGEAYLMGFDPETLTAEFWICLEERTLYMTANYTVESCGWTWRYEGDKSYFDPGYVYGFDETYVFPGGWNEENISQLAWLGLEFDLTTERLAE